MIAGTTGVGIWLYRLGLGWLLDDRFLLLTHRDRWTRETRATVLDVVEADGRAGRYVVAAPDGERPDWLLDVAREPRVHVNVGADSFAAVAVRLARPDTTTLVELRRAGRAAGDRLRPIRPASRRWGVASTTRRSDSCASALVNRDVLVFDRRHSVA